MPKTPLMRPEEKLENSSLRYGPGQVIPHCMAGQYFLRLDWQARITVRVWYTLFKFCKNFLKRLKYSTLITDLTLINYKIITKVHYRYFGSVISIKIFILIQFILILI